MELGCMKLWSSDPCHIIRLGSDLYNARGNKLTELPDTIKGLTAMTKLDLSCNQQMGVGFYDHMIV